MRQGYALQDSLTLSEREHYKSSPEHTAMLGLCDTLQRIIDNEQEPDELRRKWTAAVDNMQKVIDEREFYNGIGVAFFILIYPVILIVALIAAIIDLIIGIIEECIFLFFMIFNITIPLFNILLVDNLCVLTDPFIKGLVITNTSNELLNLAKIKDLYDPTMNENVVTHKEPHQNTLLEEKREKEPLVKPGDVVEAKATVLNNVPFATASVAKASKEGLFNGLKERLGLKKKSIPEATQVPTSNKI